MCGWKPVVRDLGPDGVRAVTVAPAQSQWFAGHFPSGPVLPGVAMLALVEETLRVFVGQSLAPPVDIVGFRRVRFRHMVLPGATLQVSVRRAKSERAFEFQVDADGTLACSGTCTV
jgi:3-hydroxymyristoyl/3-hydroxydecanoyl-(acyl carrier protein) dehydratase